MAEQFENRVTNRLSPADKLREVVTIMCEASF